MPKANKSGMSGSPCSPPSPWTISWSFPWSSRQMYRVGEAYERRTNGKMSLALGRVASFPSIAARRTWSKAPIPSMLKTHAVGSASQAARKRCPMHSVPARVDMAYWKGAHVASTSFPTIRARQLATSRRNEVPVAIPRTPPSFFCRANILVDMNASEMSLGVWALASLCAAPCIKWAVSSSSKAIFKCSFGMSPGPPEDPRGSALRTFTKSLNGMVTGCAGLCSKASLGISTLRRCGLRRSSVSCSSVFVSPGASSPCVSTWRAFEISFSRIFA